MEWIVCLGRGLWRQACRENRRSRLMLRNGPHCAACRNRSSATKRIGRGRSCWTLEGRKAAAIAAVLGVHPWTAPGAQGKIRRLSANHGRVQPSIRPCIAARRPQALMIIRRSVPYHVSGLCVRCTQRVGRSSVRPDLPSTSAAFSALSAGRFGLCGFRPSVWLKLTAVGQDRPGGARCLVRNRDGRDIGRPAHQKSGQPTPALPPPSRERSRAMDQQGADIAIPALADFAENLAVAARVCAGEKIPH